MRWISELTKCSSHDINNPAYGLVVLRRNFVHYAPRCSVLGLHANIFYRVIRRNFNILLVHEMQEHYITQL